MSIAPRHRLAAAFFVLALISSIPPIHAAEPLPAFEARYELRRNGIFLGEMTRSLQREDGGAWRFVSRSRTRGFIAWLFPDRIVEESLWRYETGRPRPERYRYRHDGRRKHRRVEIRFDWQRHLALHTVNDDPWRLRIPDGAQDKLVYQLTLMLDLADGVEAPEYRIADGGRLKDYRFRRLAEETLETPLGRLRTIRLVRLDDKRRTTIWCAPAYRYLPVRIAQTDTDGSRLVLDIARINGLSPAGKSR